MTSAPFLGIRRATLADVAAVARLSVPANREAQHDLPPLNDREELSAPELALRLLDDLAEGNALYVAERDGRIVGFGQVTGLMVGDGGHLVELRRLYVAPEHRQRGLGRQLLTLVLQELAQRPGPPALRAWAATASDAARFLEIAGGAAMRPRWKVGPGGIAVRGAVYGWTVEKAQAPAAARRRAIAK
jgi:ribosomal protein S18 acetylase RimI-like enzyme